MTYLERNSQYFWTFIVFGCISKVNTITLEKLKVPEMAIAGEQVDLSCKFDMKGMELYSLRWYKDGQEFYRFIPKQLPSSKAFNNQSMGVNVNIEESDEGNVRLKNITLKSEGLYECQVVSESPFFRIKKTTAYMKILVLPKSRVKIKGKRKRYKIGDTVNLDCTSSPSHPPSTLYWTINGEKAKEEFLASMSSGRTNDGLVNSTLTIRFELKNYMINSHGVLQVKCYSVIPPHYNSSVSTWITHNMVSGPTKELIMNDRRYSSISTLSHTNSAPNPEKNVAAQLFCGGASVFTFSNLLCVIILIFLHSISKGGSICL